MVVTYYVKGKIALSDRNVGIVGSETAPLSVSTPTVSVLSLSLLSSQCYYAEPSQSQYDLKGIVVCFYHVFHYIIKNSYWHR